METGKPPLIIRSVYAGNFTDEFNLMNSALDKFPYVAVDTEYPGNFFKSSKPFYRRTAEEEYLLVRMNVDNTHLIQLGIALFDADGNMPDLGTGGAARYSWEYNFSDFDLSRHFCDPKSIELLLDNGMQLHYIRAHGIPSYRFGEAFWRSSFVKSDNVSWVSFHGAYDFAYIAKMVSTGTQLPATLREFLEQVERMFGKVYDVKSMIRWCDGLYGGLDRVAGMLKVGRDAGRSHNAGSDSVMAALTFAKMVKLYFPNQNLSESRHVGRFYGLDR